MPFNISLVLDSIGLIKKDLQTFSSLEELDLFTSNYSTPLELRKEYEYDILNYLDENQNYLEKSRFKRGRICITYYDEQNNIRFFPIIYKNNNILLDSNLSFKLISNALVEDSVLKEIFINKKYLLSNNEKDLLKLYFMYKNIKYKKLFLNDFLMRIKKSKNLYLYLRSLFKVCNLLERNSYKETNKESEIDILSNDLYFEQLVLNQDYDNLYRYYDLDYIEKNLVKK